MGSLIARRALPNFTSDNNLHNEIKNAIVQGSVLSEVDLLEFYLSKKMYEQVETQINHIIENNLVYSVAEGVIESNLSYYLADYYDYYFGVETKDFQLVQKELLEEFLTIIETPNKLNDIVLRKKVFFNQIAIVVIWLRVSSEADYEYPIDLNKISFP